MARGNPKHRTLLAVSRAGDLQGRGAPKGGLLFQNVHTLFSGTSSMDETECNPHVHTQDV